MLKNFQDKFNLNSKQKLCSWKWKDVAKDLCKKHRTVWMRNVDDYKEEEEYFNRGLSPDSPKSPLLNFTIKYKFCTETDNEK